MTKLFRLGTTSISDDAAIALLRANLPPDEQAKLRSADPAKILPLLMRRDVFDDATDFIAWVRSCLSEAS